MPMTLKVRVPERVVLDTEAAKVVAEGQEGGFGVLPRHIDYVAPLVPGLLAYTLVAESPEDEAEEVFLAVDEGVLVKCGRDVLVSVRDAVVGGDLDALEATVRDRFQERRAREEAMHAALAKLEAEVVRRFVELNE